MRLRPRLVGGSPLRAASSAASGIFDPLLRLCATLQNEHDRLRFRSASHGGRVRPADEVIFDAVRRFRAASRADAVYSIHADFLDGMPEVDLQANGQWLDKGREAAAARALFRPVIRALAARGPRGFFETTAAPPRRTNALWVRVAPNQTTALLFLDGAHLGWQRSFEDDGSVETEAVAVFEPKVALTGHERIALRRESLPTLRAIPRVAAILRLGFTPKAPGYAESGDLNLLRFAPEANLIDAALAAASGAGPRSEAP